MKLFLSEAQLGHVPRQFMVHGRIVDPFENANRLETLAATLESAGCARMTPDDFGRDPILRVHDASFIDFLKTAWQRWQDLPNCGPEVLPNVHPYRGAAPDLAPRPHPRPAGIVGLAGWYLGDMACAIMEGTWSAVYASVQTAVAGAQAILAGDRAAYALCRPPGHHAYADRASGFCFLNNAAIAAEMLRDRFVRVAIIDFDTHHGDGTQAIFYARPDVFFGSVHTDPSAYYPHFVGYADERGAGAGEGANLDIPLPQGSGDDAFVAAVGMLAEAVRSHGSEALVVSAGWDAHRDDPLSRLAVTTQAYRRIAETLAALRVPTLIVQEGGYSLSVIREAAPLFVESFRARHG